MSPEDIERMRLRLLSTTRSVQQSVREQALRELEAKEREEREEREREEREREEREREAREAEAEAREREAEAREREAEAREREAEEEATAVALDSEHAAAADHLAYTRARVERNNAERETARLRREFERHRLNTPSKALSMRRVEAAERATVRAIRNVQQAALRIAHVGPGVDFTFSAIKAPVTNAGRLQIPVGVRDFGWTVALLDNIQTAQIDFCREALGGVTLDVAFALDNLEREFRFTQGRACYGENMLHVYFQRGFGLLDPIVNPRVSPLFDRINRISFMFSSDSFYINLFFGPRLRVTLTIHPGRAQNRDSGPCHLAIKRIQEDFDERALVGTPSIPEFKIPLVLMRNQGDRIALLLPNGELNAPQLARGTVAHIQALAAQYPELTEYWVISFAVCNKILNQIVQYANRLGINLGKKSRKKKRSRTKRR